jgi:hypothetical protein
MAVANGTRINRQLAHDSLAVSSVQVIFLVKQSHVPTSVEHGRYSILIKKCTANRGTVEV